VASTALRSLLEAIDEVRALQQANPSPSTTSPFRRPEVKRAIGRAQVVLLSSHFERYFYELNEEAVEFLISTSINVESLPLEIRLVHSRSPVDAMVETSWENRETALRKFARLEAPLWDDSSLVESFQHDRLLEWMSTPKSNKVKRYFGQWEISDIFSSVTRKDSIRTDLWLRIDELVEKRNNIAHGDLAVEATHLDIVKYLKAIQTFTSRVDRHFAKTLGRLAGVNPPW
jgi:hypothetical protein